MVNILTNSSKTKKGESKEWLTAISYLSPSTESSSNLCPWSTPGCSAACLGHSSGRLSMAYAKANRLKRSKLFIEDRARFFRQLECEIENHIERAESRGMNAAVRLNGSSDIPFERIYPSLYEQFKNVQFYDYTKGFNRMKRFLGGALPANLHLTFSRGETVENRRQAWEILRLGGNVAVVFDEIPRRYRGYPVIDGEQDDLRFLDRERPGIVGLRQKGKALRDDTGFVIRIGRHPVAA